MIPSTTVSFDACQNLFYKKSKPETTAMKGTKMVSSLLLHSSVFELDVHLVQV